MRAAPHFPTGVVHTLPAEKLHRWAMPAQPATWLLHARCRLLRPVAHAAQETRPTTTKPARETSATRYSAAQTSTPAPCGAATRSNRARPRTRSHPPKPAGVHRQTEQALRICRDQGLAELRSFFPSRSWAPCTMIRTPTPQTPWSAYGGSWTKCGKRASPRGLGGHKGVTWAASFRCADRE